MREKRQKKGVGVRTRMLSFTLALTLVFGFTIPGFAGETESETAIGTESVLARKAALGAKGEGIPSDVKLTALGEVSTVLGDGGLIGFDGEYALTDGGEATTVIVVLKSAPAQTQVFEASIQGIDMSESEAEQNMDDDRELFMQELNSVLGSQNARAASAVTVNAEYRHALNGMAVTVPAYAVKAMEDFESVYAVFPNETVTAGPTEIVPVTAGGDEYIADVYDTLINAGEDEGPEGNALGREHSGADVLHDAGYKGEGIVVAVLDTGVDYNHPAFDGAFMTEEEWVARGGSADDCIGGYFYGRNYINEADYDLGNYLTNNGLKFNPNDPMETTYDRWKNSGYESPDANGSDFYTAHGTHVSGTIASRPVEDHANNGGSMGVAPESKLIVYRVLGPFGMGDTANVLQGVEQTAVDKPDVVNMSLGSPDNGGYSAYSYAVNNIVIGSDWNIVFVVSAGNSGPGLHTVGSTGVASSTITVANAVEPNPLSDLVVNGLSAGSGYTAASEWSLTPGGWMDNDYFPADESGYWNFMPMPKWNNYIERDNGVVYPELGYGTVSEWKHLLLALGHTEADKLVAPRSQSEVIDAADISNFYSSMLMDTPELEGVLDGLWIGVARGSDFVVNMNIAEYFGAGGLIMVNRDNTALSMQNDGNSIPFLYFNHADGVTFMNSVVMGSAENKISVKARPRGLVLNSSSSRGPVGDTLELKPDVTAHGTDVLSTVPVYFSDTANQRYEIAYANMTGTSMSSPNVAGEVALLRDFNYDWDVGEIKARLMNTAENLNEDPIGEKYSVYEQGAGYAHVDLAAYTDVIAYATYDRALADPAKEADGFLSTNTGSLSFGGINLYGNDGRAYSRKITVTVQNNTDEAKNYSIEEVVNTVGQGADADWPDGAEIEFSGSSVNVPANDTATFTATISLPAGLGISDEYQLEGWVRLTSGDDVIDMPFAAATEAINPYLENLTLERDVVTPQEFYNFVEQETDTSYDYDEYLKTTQVAQDYLSGELILGFDVTSSYGLVGNVALYEADDFDPADMEGNKLVGIVGGTPTYFVPPSLAEAFYGSRQYAYIPFNGLVYTALDENGSPADTPVYESGHINWVFDTEVYEIVPDGDYIVYVDMWAGAESAAGTTFSPAQAYTLPVKVDRTKLEVQATMTGLEVEGSVRDADEYTALFALPNIWENSELEEENYGLAEEVVLENDGTFSYTAPLGTESVTLYAISEYKPVQAFGTYVTEDTVYVDFLISNLTDDLYDIGWISSDDNSKFYVGGAITTLEVSESAQGDAAVEQTIAEPENNDAITIESVVGTEEEYTPDADEASAQDEVSVTVNDVTGDFIVRAAAGVGGKVVEGGGTNGYAVGDTVTLTAEPDPGFMFMGWYENWTPFTNVETIDQNDFIVYEDMENVDRAIHAKFSPEILSLDLSATAGGTVKGGGLYTADTQVTVTAVPDRDYSFDGWYSEDVKVDNADESYSFTLTENTELEARFTLDLPHVTSVVVKPDGQDVMQGGTWKFAADVKGNHTPNLDVKWSVSGNLSDATSIDEDGQLSVSIVENAKTLTVRAVSVQTPEVYGLAKVNIKLSDNSDDLTLEDLESMDNSEIEEAMKDGGIIDRIKELERVYEEDNDVDREIVVDSNTHGNFHNTVSSIDVVGASLNADSGETITLHFSKPEKSQPINSSQYSSKNSVQIDIKLLRDNVEVTSELRVPIAITLKIPSGIDQDDFRILHHATDGSYEVIIPIIKEGGYCTFIITHFSVFTFVNRASGDNNSSDNESSGGGSGSGNSSSGASSSNAAPATRHVVINDGGNDGGYVTTNVSDPKKGDTVTITITPNSGFALGMLTITDAQGNTVEFVDNNDGTYTYVQPDGDVTIRTVFSEKVTSPKELVSRLLNTDDHVAYMGGLPDGSFGARNGMTRAQAAQMFYNLLRDKDIALTKEFTDVSSDGWYYTPVSVLASLGVISGKGDGSYFDPNAYITRAQFATIAVKFAELSMGSAQFDDVQTNRLDYAFISTAANFGWMTGSDLGFEPDRTIIRAEAVTTVNKMLGRTPDKELIDRGNFTQFPDVSPTYWAYYEIMEATNTFSNEIEESWQN